MLKKANPAVVITGVIVIVIAAALIIFKTATAPSETINQHADQIPPKGAGKFDRGN